MDGATAKQTRVGKSGRRQGDGLSSLDEVIGAKAAERWVVDHRIRDVEEGPDGSLWMLEDANPGALIHVTPK